MAFALSSDEKTLALATAGNAKIISLVDARTSRSLGSWPVPQFAASLALAGDGKVVAASDGGSVWLYSLSGKVERQLPVKKVHKLAFSPDASRLAIGTDGGQVQIWRLK